MGRQASLQAGLVLLSLAGIPVTTELDCQCPCGAVQEDSPHHAYSHRHTRQADLYRILHLEQQQQQMQLQHPPERIRHDRILEDGNKEDDDDDGDFTYAQHYQDWKSYMYYRFEDDDDEFRKQGTESTSASSTSSAANNDDNNNYYQHKSYYYKGNKNGQQHYHHHSKWSYVIQASATLFCVMISAMASGLYIGLLALDPLLLVIKSRTSKSEKERKRANQLLTILVHQKHQLLVTLLIINCMAAEAMPVFLQRLVQNASAAICLSVVLVLVFGEIIPTVLFAGVDPLRIASRVAPIVQGLMWILYPIVWPIASLMEVLSSGGVGGCTRSNHHNKWSCTDDNGEAQEPTTAVHLAHPTGTTVYNRGELAALIRVQYEQRRALREQRREALQEASLMSLHSLDDNTLTTSSVNLGPRISHRRNSMGDRSLELNNNSGHGMVVPPPPPRRNKKMLHKQASCQSIDSVDMNIMEGALQLKSKTAMDIFLGFHKVFCVSYDTILDDANIFTIYASGYSRVPVFCDGDRRRIKGILMTRQLMVVKQYSTSSNNNNNSKDKESPEQQQQPPSLADLPLYIPPCVAPEMTLADLFQMFQNKQGNSSSRGRSSGKPPGSPRRSVVTHRRSGHQALVCARPHIGNAALERGEALPDRAGLMGIVTLEDVLEALLQEEIYDEMDHHQDPQHNNPHFHFQQYHHHPFPCDDHAGVGATCIDTAAASIFGAVDHRGLDDMPTIEEVHSRSFHSYTLAP